MRKIFEPQAIPDKFDIFLNEMAIRPFQMKASEEELAKMVPEAFAMRGQYADIRVPVVIIAGDEDRLIDIENRSARLHGARRSSSRL